MTVSRNLLVAAILLAGAGAGCAAQAQKDYPVTPVPFTAVHLTDAFWAPRMETNRKVTIPYAFGQCEENGRMDNFKIAGGLMQGKHRGGFPFDDTDPYKIAEGAAYALALQPDPALDKYLDDLIALIAAAQEDDGYLYTCRTNQAENLKNWYGDRRWAKLQGSHELYNAGHLYEAAVAHFEATGKRTFLDVAIKNADLLDRTFGPDKLRLPPGHQIVEMGLVRLYRATGDARYLALAKFFLDARGQASDGRKVWGPYCQDHKPVVEQDEAVGHAVRASYMYSGMADIAALTADARYLEASDRLWENVVRKKLYLTGGIGARGSGEAFGDNYELPNATAYCETCAAIGNVYWNHRMFLLHGDARYLDVLERTLYNALLSGVSMDGKLFFYPNPLESRGNYRRSPWFGCACCPGNIARFMASVPRYAYAHGPDTLYVNLFAAGEARVTVGGQTVRVTQETRYPWDGAVRIALAPERPARFTVCVRIPGWAQGRPVPSDLYRYADAADAPVTLKVNGAAQALDLAKGFARIDRTWKAGDAVDLALPMPVRRVLAHESVADDKGRVALERGPLVYCAEWPDQPDGRVLNLMLPDGAALAPEFRADLLGGVTVVRGKAVALARAEDGKALVKTDQDFLAIPYYAWAHRGPGEMAVWLARDESAAAPLPGPTIASTSKPSTSFQRDGGEADLTVTALNDQLEPKSSGDRSVPFCHWWPHKGTREWVQYDFAKRAKVAAVEVYWFDDTGRGECRVPQSWSVLYREGGQWKPVAGASAGGVEKDRVNRVTFDAVETDGLRLEVQLRPDVSGGILEWRVLPAPAGDSTASAAQTSAAPPKPAENALPNPSFEEQAGRNPRAWRPDRWNGEAAHQVADIGHTGGRCVLIASDKGADVAWAATVAVEPQATYRLSGWIRTEDVKVANGRGALLNVHGLQAAATRALTGTTDWTRVEVTFETGDQDAVQVNCLFGGWGLATGKAWFDDLRLELVSKGADVKASITIDAGRKGEPVSKYVYGQFIEHLGRCIYGGIWAEMLEDRKFYYPVTPKYDPYGRGRRPSKDNPAPVVAASPWQILGAPDSVRMVKEDAFVGEHTPLVSPGGGIRQNDLGLVQGKEYVGYVWLKPQGPSAAVEVALRWGEGAGDAARAALAPAGKDYRRFPFRLRAGAAADAGALEVRVTQGSPCFVGTVSLMPADHVQGLRADTLDLLKQLDSPVYRWPGGNFVSGYDWKDGIGDRDRRPPRKNPAWTGVEHNDFGLDEFMVFCRLLGTDPYIAVNSGLGDAKAAAEELQYANGAPDTPMGQRRAKNGHPEPYRVPFWSIGNEMYGNWQLGNMPLEKYVLKHNEFAEAMRAVDPSIRIIAVGDAGPWSEGMMKQCADHMDLVSEHFYCQERPGLAGHVRQIPDAIRRKAEAHRRYRREFDSLKGKDIRIALDEWNYWYGPHVFGELGTRYFLKDALGIAAGLHEYARNSDLFYMANYAQTVNVIGCIKTTKTAASMATTGLALALYRKHFGAVPVETATTSLIDAQAAWTADGKTLTIAVVNPTTRAVDIALSLTGTKLTGRGTRWQIAGDDPMAYNEPGKPPTVSIEEAPVQGVADTLSVAPCSVTLFELGVR